MGRFIPKETCDDDDDDDTAHSFLDLFLKTYKLLVASTTSCVF